MWSIRHVPISMNQDTKLIWFQQEKTSVEATSFVKIQIDPDQLKPKSGFGLICIVVEKGLKS